MHSDYRRIAHRTLERAGQGHSICMVPKLARALTWRLWQDFVVSIVEGRTEAGTPRHAKICF